MCRELISFDTSRQRIKNHFATLRIDDDLMASASSVIKVAQTNNCGKAESPCDYRHVRGPTSRISGNCFHMVQIQFGDCRRQEILSDDYCVFRKIWVTTHLTGKIDEQTLDYIFNIGATFA